MKSLFALGYAGWGPGQLEGELARHDWFTTPAEPRLIFDDDRANLWEERDGAPHPRFIAQECRVKGANRYGVRGLGLWGGERLGAVHDAGRHTTSRWPARRGRACCRRMSGRIVADRRRAAPDPPRRQRHLRHHPVDPDRHARLPVEHRHRHLTRRIMFVVDTGRAC